MQGFHNAINWNHVTILQNFQNNNIRTFPNNDIAVNRVVPVNVLSGGDVILFYQ